MREVVIEGAVMLWMTWPINFTNRADIPLAVGTDMPQVMTFEASFLVLRVGVRKGGINGYAM